MRLSEILTAGRIRAYALSLLILYAIWAVMVITLSKSMVDTLGRPLGYDFITFYSAAKLTLAGDPVAAFDLNRIFAEQKAAVPASNMPFQWAYPPTYQLISAPLALLPYGASYIAFMVFSAGALTYGLWRLTPAKPYLPLLICAPGVALCVFHGQNALLSTALFAVGFALLRDRPFWSGIVLAGLAFKPQLGILLPIALIAASQWRAFAGAVLGVAVFTAAATLILGTALWHAFFAHMSFVEEITRNGMLPWAKMPSAFIFLRLLGVPEIPAVGAQALCAALAALSVVLVWRHRGATDPWSWATLVTATLLVSPYVFDYECSR